MQSEVEDTIIHSAFTYEFSVRTLTILLLVFFHILVSLHVVIWIFDLEFLANFIDDLIIKFMDNIVSNFVVKASITANHSFDNFEKQLSLCRLRDSYTCFLTFRNFGLFACLMYSSDIKNPFIAAHSISANLE